METLKGKAGVLYERQPLEPHTELPSEIQFIGVTVFGKQKTGNLQPMPVDQNNDFPSLSTSFLP